MPRHFKYFLAVKSLFFTLFFFIISRGFSEVIVKDTTYYNNIQTVLLYKTGQINTLPVLDLSNQQATLTLAFDDLEGGYKELQYTLIHCTHNWEISDLFESDYLDGNIYEDIDQYEYSFNTYVDYANYRLTFPSENMRIKIPGNYIIKVYFADDEENVLLTRRFFVVDQSVKMTGQVKRPAYAKYINRKQEVDFTVDYSLLDVRNPMKDIHVVIRQNKRWDNEITGLKPNYMESSKLIYNFEEENLFDGLSEWRYVDMRSLSAARSGVQKITLDTLYRMILLVDEDRSLITYSQWSDINGDRVIASDNTDLKYNELDYIDALFRLTTPFPVEEEEVYLFGAFTDWKIMERFKMKYYPEKNMFYKNVLLKQGYYNYYYAVIDKNGNIDCTRFQGTHYETENDYSIYVYFNSPVYNADLLVGILNLNSIEE